MITREDIEQFFVDNTNKLDCDFTQEQIWGYFFLDVGKERLEKLRLKLESMGYRYVDIFEAEMEDSAQQQEYYLHVEKKEYHDIDSLHQRNLEFYKLAEKIKVISYDGFDFAIN